MCKRQGPGLRWRASLTKPIAELFEAYTTNILTIHVTVIKSPFAPLSRVQRATAQLRPPVATPSYYRFKTGC